MSEDTYEGSTGNIMTQNRYSYAENDPVNKRDPGGHMALLKKIKRSARRVAKKVVKTVKTVASRVISSVRGAPKKIASAVKSASNYSRASAKATLGYVRTKYKSAEQRAKDIRKTLKTQYNSLRKKVSCGIHSESKNNNVVISNNFLASLDKTEISGSDNNLDGIHTMLDAVGVVDPFGISDGINALIYLGQGDFKNSGISALGIVPYIGDTAKGARLGAKALKFADKADDVADAGKALKKVEELNASGLYRTLKDSKSVGVGKKFTSAQKKKIIQSNMERNGGVIKSDLSGKELVPATKSLKGVTPNPLEAQIDHIRPKNKGGSNSFLNAQVLSRNENIKKSNM